MKRFKFFVHPFFVGFVLTVLAIFAFTRFFPSQKFEIIEKSQFSHKGQVYFCDIDSDGNSEKIHYYNYDRIFFPTIYLYGSDNKLKGLWNFFDLPVENSRIFFGDYNQNGIKEIFVFTHQKDSVFLHVLNPQNDKKLITKRKFIASIGDENYDFKIIPVGLFNFNNDKTKEFYFAISVDHSRIPGNFFAYDIFNDQIYSSPDIHAKILDHIVVNDLNSDGTKELLISTQTKGDDTNGASALLLVLDHQLEYFLKPFQLQGNPSRLFVDAMVNDKEKYIIALNSGISHDNIFNHLMLFDLAGNRINEKNLDFNANLIAIPNESFNTIFTLFSGQQVVQINSQLDINKKIYITRKDTLSFICSIDINHDGFAEHAFAGENMLYLLSNDYKSIGQQKICNRKEIILTLKRLDKGKNKISLQSGNNWYVMSYLNDSVSFYRYLIYLIIFIMITFMVFVFRKFFKNWRVHKNSSLNSETKHNNNENAVNQLETKYENINPHPEKRSLYNDIGQFGTALNQVKEKFDKDSEYKPNVDIKREVDELFAGLKGNIELSFYPKGNWHEIDRNINNTVIRLLKHIIKFTRFDDNQMKIDIRILRHTNYLNILLEIDQLDYKNIFIENQPETERILNDLNGKIDIDFSPGIGTITSFYIPLGDFASPETGKNKKIRLIIAEDHDVSLFGLVTLFKNRDDFEIVDTAKNGMEVLKILEKKNADIIITDISMPGMDGIELTEYLNINYPEIKVIVFTMYLENWFVEQLTKNGAKGFVAKNSKITELIDAVHHVYEGYNYYCPQFKSKYGFNNKENSANNQLDSLNSYERDILKYFADNLTKPKIAKTLNINAKMLDTFIANIMLKLNAGDINEVIRIAKKQKYISG